MRRLLGQRMLRTSTRLERMVVSEQQDVAIETTKNSEELSLDERLEEVRRAAHAAGFADGQVDGFIDGYDQGFAEKYDESFAEGHAVGFAEGYQQGVDDGYKEGHGNGLKKGRYEGFDAGKSEDYVRGYKKGFEAGEKEGFFHGCDVGCEKGLYDGYDSGFNEAYKKGFAEGSVEDQEMQKYIVEEGRKQELGRHLNTARKLVESGMSIEEVEQLTSFNPQEMARLVKLVRKHAKAHEQAK